MQTRNIRHLNLKELESFFHSKGEPGFRAVQVYDWLWKKSARSFDEMTNLSKKIREILKESFVLEGAIIDYSQESNDGTVKNAVRLIDGKKVECVLIPAGKRITACVSSQVGCSLDCRFCATAKLKRERNLTSDEIYDEVVFIQKQALEKFNTPLTNIVYMGMGEPLLNYANVLDSIEKITSPAGLNLSAKRITLSTAGIAKMIKKLGDDGVKFNLAVSLHAATDEKRDKIMPVNRAIPLKELKESLRYFYNKTHSQISFEYIVFNDFNDTPEDAYRLAEFCKQVPSKVNLIEYNPIGEGGYRQTAPDKLNIFLKFMKNKGIITNVRRSRGKDIDAACGQLANRVLQHQQ